MICWRRVVRFVRYCSSNIKDGLRRISQVELMIPLRGFHDDSLHLSLLN